VARSIKTGLRKSPGADQLVAGRINDARRLAAKQITEKVVEIVKDRIPNEGGWYKIYREALTYFSTKDGTLWAASGLWPKDYSEFPADTTLIEFVRAQGGIAPGVGGKVETALVSYNPWTVDQLPALNGGIRAEAKAKIASTSEVEAQRDRLVAAQAAIKKALLDAGATYVDEVPTIQGKVYADVAWMATALEHGLAGLPRLPHWIRALRRVQQDSGAMVAPVKDQIGRILNGEEKFDESGDEMPPKLAAKLGL
jgi:hypothetical protein